MSSMHRGLYETQLRAWDIYDVPEPSALRSTFYKLSWKGGGETNQQQPPQKKTTAPWEDTTPEPRNKYCPLGPSAAPIFLISFSGPSTISLSSFLPRAILPSPLLSSPATLFPKLTIFLPKLYVIPQTARALFPKPGLPNYTRLLMSGPPCFSSSSRINKLRKYCFVRLARGMPGNFTASDGYSNS